MSCLLFVSLASCVLSLHSNLAPQQTLDMMYRLGLSRYTLEARQARSPTSRCWKGASQPRTP